MNITGSIMMNKYLGKSQYEHVYIRELRGGQIVYVLSVNNKKYGNIQKCFTDEKEAAMYLDKILIQKGFEPINILKRK